MKNKLTKQFYVYVLTDSSTNIPFYVGKGTGNRMYQHENDAKYSFYKKKRSVHTKIEKLKRNNIPITYEQILCESEDEAFELEINMIAQYGRKDLKTGTLCNLSSGGEGSRDASPESIQKRADWHRGRKRPEISVQRMRDAQTTRRANGFRESEETKAKQRANKLSRGKDSSETIEKRRKSSIQPVIQYTLDMIEVARFECVADAAKAIGAARGTSISSCCTRISEEAHGFVWRYQNPEHDIISPSVLRPVHQIHPTGDITVKTWDTILEAARAVGIRTNQLVACCKGRYHTGAGWIWKYADGLAINMQNNRNVHQCDMITHKIIKTWESVMNAATELGLNQSGIIRCCRGELHTSAGFYWKYADE